jgi:hypothetical protein
MQLKKLKLIEPSSYQEDLCNKFSLESATNQKEFYATKGEGDIIKLKQWAYIGKMAEYAIFNTLISFPEYKIVSPPDIMIYERKRKSHAADIVADGKQVHVKSFMSKEGRNPSWLFSTEDRIVENPSEEDIVALVIVTLPKTFEAYFVPAKKLVGLYEKPINPTTIANAIYESTLLQ